MSEVGKQTAKMVAEISGAKSSPKNDNQAGTGQKSASSQHGSAKPVMTQVFGKYTKGGAC